MNKNKIVDVNVHRNKVNTELVGSIKASIKSCGRGKSSISDDVELIPRWIFCGGVGSPGAAVRADFRPRNISKGSSPS